MYFNKLFTLEIHTYLNYGLKASSVILYMLFWFLLRRGTWQFLNLETFPWLMNWKCPGIEGWLLLKRSLVFGLVCVAFCLQHFFPLYLTWFCFLPFSCTKEGLIFGIRTLCSCDRMWGFFLYICWFTHLLLLVGMFCSIWQRSPQM